MLIRAAVCFVLAACSVWVIERGGLAIVHSSGGIGLVIVFCPGMLPVFLGFFENEYAAWTVATALTAAYYMFIWKAFTEFRSKRVERHSR
jgi:hypothetical protein